MTEKKERAVGSGPDQVLSNTGANIDEFTYSCEGAKIEFQANVGSLLELHSLLSSRLSEAEQRGKPGVFFTSGEIDVFKDWLLQTSTSLLENYTLIDSTLRKTNRLYKAVSRMHLKDIAA